MKAPSGLCDLMGLQESTMTTQEPSYLAYLLRVWQVESDGKLTWRASLESVHTGERRGFASLEILFEFLKGQTQGNVTQSQVPEIKI